MGDSYPPRQRPQPPPNQQLLLQNQQQQQPNQNPLLPHHHHQQRRQLGVVGVAPLAAAAEVKEGGVLGGVRVQVGVSSE